jgi:hypothetical protein
MGMKSSSSWAAHDLLMVPHIGELGNSKAHDARSPAVKTIDCVQQSFPGRFVGWLQVPETLSLELRRECEANDGAGEIEGRSRGRL